MERSGESEAAPRPLAGETLFVVGRVQGLTRNRLDHLVRQHGGKLTAKPGARITLLAFGHTASSMVMPDGKLRLPAGLPANAPMIGEIEFRRRLGLLRPPDNVARSMTAADLQRLANISAAQLACLALFDVVEPVDDRYGYRDLVAAREAGRLLASGVQLGRVLEAGIVLRRRGQHLSEARLTEGPSGSLVRELAGQIAELNGQLTMSLDNAAPSVDEIVAEAEKAEAEGDWATAESLYTTALRADANDPVLPFNLGNIFDAQQRPAEAKVAWQIAAARDPAFAEAWYNLAMAAEDESETDLAIAEYRRAVKAQPDYADAHFNLALLLTKLDRCAEALPLWDRFLELAPQSPQVVIAKRAATLCRMQIAQAQVKAG